MKWLFPIVAAVIIVGHLQVAFAQFSPGDLARAHESLEGMNHCADCHEVGKEISGMKCLACHAEIKRELDLKRGYHFAVSAANCVSCHKEHLGKDAQITVFDRSNFDHAKTGFTLTGKHASRQCSDCHNAKFIKDPDVARKRHRTSLGLNTACVSCHEDRHKGVLGTDCKSCHTTSVWKPASNFDHSKTKFVLVGKHRDVECSKCHTEAAASNQSLTSLLSTKPFSDCTPCHKSPHSAKFSTQTCTSCHVPTGWREVSEQQFNHELTKFRLRGKHALVKCNQCHKPDTKASGGRVLKPAHDRCTNCHSDYHEGEFLAKYANDCASCHTDAGYRPSTFTLTRHDASRFPLRGAHIAVPCARCHKPSSSDRSVFRLTNMKCETCHKDPHGGQFKTLMGEAGCTKCHSTDEWKNTTFDHSVTSFALAGKHQAVSCSNCHKPGTKSNMVEYKGVSTKCESCHADPHTKQFAANGATNCTACHTPNGWTLLVFDHEKQSSFSLTGAHKKVSCRSCHREEQIGNKTTIRYKPLSSRCESCHAQKEMKNG